MDVITSCIEKKAQWELELRKLREAVIGCDLEETIKWGAPIYMNKGGNILGLSAFKNYVGLWFFQEGTLKDAYDFTTNTRTAN